MRSSTAPPTSGWSSSGEQQSFEFDTAIAWVGISPDGSRLYVCTAFNHQTLHVLDTATFTTATSTRLKAHDTRPVAPRRVPGLTVRLTTTEGAPVPGEPLRFTSAGGLDLGTAVTDEDGRVNHTAEVLLPWPPRPAVSTPVA